MNILRNLVLCLAAAMTIGAAGRQQARWLETYHDFGAFAESDGPVSCRFYLVNTGDEPVAIVAARASCGCTAPQYPRGSIAPGDTAAVTVTYDPAGRPGHFRKYVAVDLSYPDSRTKLDIAGTVIGSEASVGTRYPAQCAGGIRMAKGALMVGDVTKGRMQTAFLGVYNTSDSTVTVRAEQLPPYLEMAAQGATIGAGEQSNLTFLFRSDRCPDYGLVEANILLLVGDQGCSLPVSAIVSEDFSGLDARELERAPVAYTEVSALDFGSYRRGSEAPVTRTFTVYNHGRSNLLIRRVYSVDPGVTARAQSVKIKPGKSAEITVEFTPSAVRGAFFNARLSLITNDPAAPVKTIRLTATPEE